MLTGPVWFPRSVGADRHDRALGFGEHATNDALREVREPCRITMCTEHNQLRFHLLGQLKHMLANFPGFDNVFGAAPFICGLRDGPAKCGLGIHLQIQRVPKFLSGMIEHVTYMDMRNAIFGKGESYASLHRDIMLQVRREDYVPDAQYRRG